MLTPQKNKSGQRVYRRKDVEMVFRIRDLLYEEKFTIAGAKKKLQDESRTASVRTRLAERDDDDPGEAHSADASSPKPNPPSQQTHRVLRIIKTDLEDLLTRLNADASIKR